jgi:hypothetical protein
MPIANRSLEARVGREGSFAGRFIVRRGRLLALAVALVSFAAPDARAAELPPPPEPYRDAAEADLIVEGRIVGHDRVAVDRMHFAATPLAENQREITVRGLARYARGLAQADGVPDGESANVRVLLLLERGDRAADWKPLWDWPSPHLSPYCTYWISGDRVWSYSHTGRPIALSRWSGTPERLRSEVALGIAARRAWEEDLAVPDPAERARRLLRWVQPSSPDGDRWTLRKRTSLEMVVRLGAPAVPALLAALAENEGNKEVRREVLSALGQMGPAARAAVPRLVELALDPARSGSRSSLAYALAESRDPRALAALRAILAEEPLSTGTTLMNAASGLVRLGDPEAADRIAARLPGSLEGLAQSKEGKCDPVYGILFLLEALEPLDPERMRAWLKPRAADPLFTGSGNPLYEAVRNRVARLLRTDGLPTK